MYVCYAYIIPEIEKRSENGCFRGSRFLIAGPGVYFVSPGLLQLTVLRHHRRSDEPAAVCPECGCTFGVGRSTLRPHHASATVQELHWLPVRRRVDFKMATLVYLSLSGMAPAYLAADCQLVSNEGRRQLRSATSRTCVNCKTNLQQLWRQVFCSCRSEAAEQPSS